MIDPKRDVDSYLNYARATDLVISHVLETYIHVDCVSGTNALLAASLYQSVHIKIADLQDGIEIHPAHGAGSLCGAGMSQRPQSTLGYQGFCNVFLGDYDEQRSINSILSTVPEFPDYYRRMKKINADGPVVLKGLPEDTPLEPDEFREIRDGLDAILIDLRRPEAFGGAHIPTAFSNGAGQDLSVWAAWVIP